jgi:hypothetical protein
MHVFSQKPCALTIVPFRENSITSAQYTYVNHLSLRGLIVSETSGIQFFFVDKSKNLTISMPHKTIVYHCHSNHSRYEKEIKVGIQEITTKRSFSGWFFVVVSMCKCDGLQNEIDIQWSSNLCSSSCNS